MPRVVHFEIPVDDPERAVRFYSKVFNWKIEKWGGDVDYWVVTTGDKSQPGIDGGIMKRKKPLFTVVNSVDVPSVDESVKKVVASGGKVVMPKMPVMGVGWVAYCQDTEGNNFGVFQADMSAK